MRLRIVVTCILLVLVTFGLGASPEVTQALEPPQEVLFHVRVCLPDGTPAANARAYAYSYLENRYVYSGRTDAGGTLCIYYETPTPVLLETGRPIVDAHFSVMVFAQDNRHMTVYDFSVAYRKDHNGVFTRTPLVADGRQLTELILTKADPPSTKALGQGIEPMTPIRLWYTTHYSVPTEVGEIHTSANVSSVFKYGQSSGSRIDVGIKYVGQGWQVSGSVVQRNYTGWDVTWPALTTSGQAYGRKAISQFNYIEEYWEDDTTGLCWYKVYASQYNGGALWGNYTYGQDDLPWSGIESGTYGNWAAYLPGSDTERTVANGWYYSMAATVNAEAGAVTLGNTTQYDNYTKHRFSFGSGRSKYYLYDYDGSGWKRLFVSYKP